MEAVLLSGGLDSLVCAETARKNGALSGCVFIDYGHPAQIPEGWKAFSYCGSRQIRLKVVHVFGLDLGDMSSGVGARVVPCRNAILLAAAANAAFSMGADTLTVGAILEDQEDYADCRPEFFLQMSKALGLRVSAPLIETSKLDVLRLAGKFGLRASDSWSCYGPGPEPCGTCPSCVVREQAERVMSEEEANIIPL